MKTLIINGSPRKNGHTADLVNRLRKYIEGDSIEISAYYDGIKPCNDCRSCWEDAGCTVKDKMDVIYNDDYDLVIIASPVYMSSLPGPLISLASRFQAYYAAKRFLKEPIQAKKKTGILILTGGGDGSPDHAIKICRWMLKYMNADTPDENTVFSLNTDVLSASLDEEAISKIDDIGRRLYGK